MWLLRPGPPPPLPVHWLALKLAQDQAHRWLTDLGGRLICVDIHPASPRLKVAARHAALPSYRRRAAYSGVNPLIMCEALYRRAIVVRDVLLDTS